MRDTTLRMLTWGTATAAVSSALWLSSTNQGELFCAVGYRATSEAMGLELPSAPTRAGPAARAGSGAPSGAATQTM